MLSLMLQIANLIIPSHLTLKELWTALKGSQPSTVLFVLELLEQPSSSGIHQELQILFSLALSSKSN